LLNTVWPRLTHCEFLPALPPRGRIGSRHRALEPVGGRTIRHS
jgi:hypothetical protein